MQRFPLLALVAVTAVWGVTFVQVQDALALYPLFAFLAVRFAISTAVLAPFAWSSLRTLPLSGYVAGVGVGALLAQKARALADAGLSRITVSLDSLDDEVFRAMNDVDFPVARVLAGIDAAAEAGLPVKVNVVVKRGLNEASVLDIARRFRGTGHTVRFIEYMDVGASNGWRLDDVVPAAEIVSMIGAEFPLEPLEAAYRGEVAERYRYLDGAGEIGVIASVTQPFCGDCTRARISADGKLYTCLFAVRGHDLRALLRSDSSGDLEETIRAVWERRADRYSELRTAQTSALRKVEMSYIGG